jgi:hypothetical protein
MLPEDADAYGAASVRERFSAVGRW